MKTKKFFAALVLVAMIAGPALALTEQQEKLRQCNSEAGEKQLKGEARKEFMRQCLSGGKAEAANAAAKPLSPQQQKMKDCNAEAKKQQLQGDARKQFMSTCLSK